MDTVLIIVIVFVFVVALLLFLAIVRVRFRDSLKMKQKELENERISQRLEALQTQRINLENWKDDIRLKQHLTAEDRAQLQILDKLWLQNEYDIRTFS